MKTLQLKLLGSPQIYLDHQPLGGFATNKAKALLFYLAVTAHPHLAQPTPHSRDALATLLWSELADTQAKQNLRSILPDLRRHVGDYVRVERQTVTFDHTRPYWLDVDVLRRSLTTSTRPGDLVARQAAVDLYHGEFLDGFHVHDAPLFEAWVVEQREQLHTLMVKALTELVGVYAQNDNTAAALAANRRLLALDPWSEPTHRQQMRLLAQTGDRAAALAQYESCRHILAAEFGLEPLPETTAVYEQIRAGGGIPRAEPARLHPISAVNHQLAPVASRNEQRDTAARPALAGHPLPLQTKLYGRHAELARLQQWVMVEGCRLVGIFGMGGQGKTALIATFVRGLAEAGSGTDAVMSGSPSSARNGEGWIGVAPFTQVIWHSLLNAPPLTEVLQEWIYILSAQAVRSLPPSLDEQCAQLLDYLQRQRCLLVLDNLESILQGDEHSGHFRPGYETYEQLIRRLAAGPHRSCLLLTSRERPSDMTNWEEESPTIRSLVLAGLPGEAGRQLLQGRGLADKQEGLNALVEHYSGNPLALKLVAETVHELFNSDIATFLQAETLVFDDIRHVLDHQFARLTPLERELLGWLALLREPVPFPALRKLLAQPPAPRLVLEAVRSLQRRSLLEKFDEDFGLQNVVLEYTTDRLVENISRELLADNATGLTSIAALPSHLNAYPLMLAQVKEYVRASQARQLLGPVAAQLLTQLGSQGAVQQLQQHLARLRTMLPAPGYAAANLLHLLLHLGADLRGYDFSQRYLRQAYLRGVTLPQTNFAGAQFVESLFTEPFGVVYTAILSPDGDYVAAGTSEGAIYLWRTVDQQLVTVLQAHQRAVKQLSFAQQIDATGNHSLTLASASDDKRIGFWRLTTGGQVHHHLQLMHQQQEALIAVGLHPDGRYVTGVDIDGHVFVWDVGDPQRAQLVQHFATAFTRFRLVAFSQDRQTVVIGHRDGTVRLWQAATGVTSLQLTGRTGLIFTLALSHDGHLLATGGREGYLSIWQLPTGELHQVIETKAGAIRVLAISPDGKWLASGHEDLAIRLWTFDAQGRLSLQRTLLGHSQPIWSIVFGPFPGAWPAPRSALTAAISQRAAKQLLVTGSSDHTVRVWDVEMGHTLYMLRGQPRVLAAHAISSPPQTAATSHSTPFQGAEWLLAATGYDQLVHVWRGQGTQADAARWILAGARGPLYAVAINPDGRTIASGGYDRAIYLWDIASRQLRQTLSGHTKTIYTLVFHPDGKLLASGSEDGTVRLWLLSEPRNDQGRMATASLAAQPVAVLQADQDVVHALTFSPDGRCLARGGTDRLLRLWDMTQPDYPELVAARPLVQDESEEDIFAIAFSVDGTKVACSGNHLIHLWDLHSGMAPLHLRGHTNWIYSVAFSPDGEILASSSADCTICLWEVASGALQATLRGHQETVYNVAFVPDGTAVVSSSFDGTLKFWDSQSGACLNTLVVEGPYAGMEISGITGVTPAQKAALIALGAVDA